MRDGGAAAKEQRFVFHPGAVPTAREAEEAIAVMFKGHGGYAPEALPVFERARLINFVQCNASTCKLDLRAAFPAAKALAFIDSPAEHVARALSRLPEAKCIRITLCALDAPLVRAVAQRADGARLSISDISADLIEEFAAAIPAGARPNDISLSVHRDADELPDALAAIPSLTSLNIAGCAKIAHLPAAPLTHLRHFYAAGSGIAGFPDWIGACHRMLAVIIHECPHVPALVDSLPDAWLGADTPEIFLAPKDYARIPLDHPWYPNLISSD